MPPPKRPFTTSSLTSTLKSTIASQPLLSNSIDKLSSQASSLAQKTPFFNVNQHLHQQQQHHHDNVPGHNGGPPAATTIGADMIRPGGGGHTGVGPHQQIMGLSGGGSGHPQHHQQQQPQAMATTPTVDMSHLTEEERLMIQSVMAKAEMADMGIPVDTNAPSSTNLPSNASQALVQQHQQAKQQQLMNQQMNNPRNNHQQQHQQQQQQQQLRNQPQQHNQMGQASNQQDLMQQQQHQAQMNLMNQNQASSSGNFPSSQQQNMNQGGNLYTNQSNQSQFQQPQHQQSYQQQNMQNQPANSQHQAANPVATQPITSQATSVQDTRSNLPSLEQQTQQLVNQINSQFNLGGQNHQPPPSSSSSLQRTVPTATGEQQVNSARQYGNFNQNQGSNNSQQYQQQQQLLQQQQLQLQEQQQQQQRSLLDQQMRSQQLSSMDQFGNQTLMAPNQVASGLTLQQQQVGGNQNSMGQQYSTLPDQRQIQQQQPPQGQLNLNMINDQQARMLQSGTNQRSLLNLDSTNMDPMIAGQSIDPMQQQLIANSYRPTNNTLLQQTNLQQQAGLKGILGDSQMNPLDGSNFVQQQAAIQQQRQPQQDVMDPIGQMTRVTTVANNFPTSAIINDQITDANNQLVNQQRSLNFNNDLQQSLRQRQQQQQNPYDTLCSEIRFGPQQRNQQTALNPHQDHYNDHALSDQEYGGGHTSSQRALHRNQSLDRHGIMRRHESVDPGENRARSKFAIDNEVIRGPSDERTFQAYDLAQGNDFGRRSKRILPKPNPDQHHKLVSVDHQEPNVDKFREKPTRRSTRRDFNRDIREYVSESDDEVVDDDRVTENVVDKRDRDTPSGHKSSNSTNTRGQVANIDKNEEAIRVLSELRLTEQATQVMEQQQLLIKQSQELIKLQLEQQALSQELKKTIKQASSPVNNNPQQEQSNTKSNDNVSNEATQESGHQQQAQGCKIQRANSETTDTTRTKPKCTIEDEDEKPGYSDNKNTSGSSKQKSTSYYNDSDPDSPRTTSKVASTNTRFDENNNAAAGDDDRMMMMGDDEIGGRARRANESRGNRIVRKTSFSHQQQQQQQQQHNSTNSSSQTGPSLRYNRDLFQSPTDTTDSDVEPLSRNQQQQDSRNRHQKFSHGQQTSTIIKPKSVVRRREPTGLPPSPLPVAAAIQLHQMQQQHFKQQLGNSAAAAAAAAARGGRSNFMRSRSVTSSPSYHLEQAGNSGYLTDNQRNRSASPDTLSEFGGQRRRKRLPEPPTNTVPITPSMVRKMIQAQRTGSSASGKLLTSVNAHSTLLTNTHSTRNLAFERPPPNNHDNMSTRVATTHDSYPLSSSSSSAAAALNHNLPMQTSGLSTSHLGNITNVAPATTISGNSQNPTSGAGGASSDLNKFLTSTYGNSILRNSNISDVKETPELDKMISNLDEYYGLDTNKRYNTNRSLIHPSSDHAAQLLGTNDTYNTAGAGPSIISSTASPTRTLGSNITTTNYLPPHSSFSSNYNEARSIYQGNSSYLTRRSSEGESNLARLTARRPYRQANLDDSYRNYGRNFTSSSYLEGRNPASSYLGASSPVRQSRYVSPIPVSDRLAYPTTNSNFISDHYLGPAITTTGGGRFDRNTSHHYYPLRPISTQFSASSRLHTNPTGSLDCESLDYLAPSSNEQRISQIMGHPDGLGSVSSKYQHQFSNAHPTSIDSIREKYRYPGLSDTSSRYPASGLTSNEFNGARRSYLHNTNNPTYHRSFDLDSGSTYHNMRANLSPYESRTRDLRSNQQYPDPMNELTSYVNDPMGHDPTTLTNMRANYSPHTSYTEPPNRPTINSNSFSPLTKNDIINNAPKFNSIGYRFRTENQNKYVAQARIPIQCLQSRYPIPYKRILLSKNPKDRIGNGIGVRITGGQPIPNLYDKVNRCIVSSGAFVTEVFQNSNVHFMGEMQAGDQIIEWNGVNLCNRSNEEVQQILLSQFNDDEVEIVYLPQNKFNSAYDEINPQSFSDRDFHDMVDTGPDAFDTFADMNKSGRQSSVTPIVGRGRYGDETHKGSIRRKLSLSHIAHMWSK